MSKNVFLPQIASSKITFVFNLSTPSGFFGLEKRLHKEHVKGRRLFQSERLADAGPSSSQRNMKNFRTIDIRKALQRGFSMSLLRSLVD